MFSTPRGIVLPLAERGRTRHFTVDRILGHTEGSSILIGKPHTGSLSLASRHNFEDSKASADVCIKEVKWAKLTEDQRLGVLQEARLLSEFNYPFIVGFICCGFRSPIPPSSSTPARERNGASNVIMDAFAAARDELNQGDNDDSQVVVSVRELEVSSLTQDQQLQLARQQNAPAAFYIVMEHCFGGDLSQCIRVKSDILRKQQQQQQQQSSHGNRWGGGNPSLPQARAHFTEELILQWTTQLAFALARLHCSPQPILHRDIKVGNIFLQGSSGKQFTLKSHMYV